MTHKFNVGDIVTFADDASDNVRKCVSLRNCSPPYKVISMNSEYLRFDNSSIGWYHSNFKIYKGSHIKLEESLFND